MEPESGPAEDEHGATAAEGGKVSGRDAVRLRMPDGGARHGD
jgi:hypothetical protein